MEHRKFETMLSFIVPEVIRLISDKHNMNEITATTAFYNSRVYELLEDEETKIWHLSPLTIFNMYNDEISTGEIKFPEEV